MSNIIEYLKDKIYYILGGTVIFIIILIIIGACSNSSGGYSSYEQIENNMANATGIRDIEMIQKITNMNLENQNK